MLRSLFDDVPARWALVVMLAVVTTVALTYRLASPLGSGWRADAEDGLFSIWNIAARTVVADPTRCSRPLSNRIG